jgi:DNA-binding LytR/AlgR family response regulator
VLATLDTVESSVAWFRNNPQPDLVLMDIRLADGLSFDIFDQVNVSCPVIFTTAYDQYAIRAFKVNSIDYLLKPVTLPALQAAIGKLETIGAASSAFVNKNILPAMKLDSRTGFKTRFVVKVGEHLRMIPVEHVAYFASQEKSTWLNTFDGRQYPMEQFLDAVADSVDPSKFFRINRKYLVSIDAIADIVVYSGSRLLVKLAGVNHDDTIVSRERVGDFRSWIEGL